MDSTQDTGPNTRTRELISLTDEQVKRFAWSIADEGGASMLADGGTPRNGYIVGGTIYPHAVNYCTQDTVSDWINSEAVAEAMAVGGRTIGGWIDTDDNTFVLDVGEILPTLQCALVLARVRGEREIWDIAGKQCISVATGRPVRS